MNADPVVVEQTFVAPVDVVWKAITDPEQMRRWYFETMAEFEPVVGSETQFNVRVGDRDYLHLWKVTEVVPEAGIAYSWRYGGCPGDSSVMWELSETHAGTRLKLTHTGHETLRLDDSVAGRENCQAGWEYFLHQSLKDFLEQSNS